MSPLSSAASSGSSTNGYQKFRPLAGQPEASGGGDRDDIQVGSERWRLEIEGPFRRLEPNPDAFELARLALCAVTIVPLRLLLIGTFIPSYYVFALCFMTLAPDTMWAQAVNIFCIRMASRFVLLLLGFWRIDARGLEENAGRREEPRVFVSNHVGYIEILYFLYALGPSFVMKRTILRVPLIGTIAARIVDCVPVDNKGGKAGGSGSEAIAARLRRMFGEKALANGAAAPQQQQQQQQQGGGEPSSSSSSTGVDAAAAAATPASSRSSALEEGWARGWKGNPLLLFPEGTTSNGSCLLRFKTGIFAGGVPVHPVTVTYGMGRFSPAFESIFFPVHTFRTLAEPAHRLSVEYLPRFDPTPEQRADRRLYARAVQRVFCEAMGLPAVEAGYAEKTKYHTYLRKQFRRHPWGGLALLLPAPDRHRAMLESRAGGSGGGRGSPRGGRQQGKESLEDVAGVAAGGGGGCDRDSGCARAAGGEAALRRRVGQYVSS